MARPPPRSFLLRLWREQDDAPLRATLIDVAQPTETRHFATMDVLLAFLQAQGGGDTPDEHGKRPNCTPSETL